MLADWKIMHHAQQQQFSVQSVVICVQKSAAPFRHMYHTGATCSKPKPRVSHVMFFCILHSVHSLLVLGTVANHMQHVSTVQDVHTNAVLIADNILETARS